MDDRTLALQTRNTIQNYTGCSRAAAMAVLERLAGPDIRGLHALGEELAGEPDAERAKARFRAALAEAELRAAYAVVARASGSGGGSDAASAAGGSPPLEHEGGEIDPANPPLPGAPA